MCLRYGTHMFGMIVLIWCLECPWLHQFLRLHNLDWWCRHAHYSNTHTIHGCEFHWGILHGTTISTQQFTLDQFEQNKWQRWECIDGASLCCRRLGGWCVCGRRKKIGWMIVMLYLNLWGEWIGVRFRNWRCKHERVCSSWILIHRERRCGVGSLIMSWWAQSGLQSGRGWLRMNGDWGMSSVLNDMVIHETPSPGLCFLLLCEKETIQKRSPLLVSTIINV